MQAPPEYHYDEDATEAIKRQQIRGVAITYHADTAKPKQVGSKLYISDNWAHYTYDALTANHGVTIIGWDDNYPAEEFHHEVVPSEDGTSAQIKGLAPGTAYVVAHIQGLGRVIIPVDVHK